MVQVGPRTIAKHGGDANRNDGTGAASENDCVFIARHFCKVRLMTVQPQAAAASAPAALPRRFGLLQATALNMSTMIGVGPFITIPVLMAAMGGPQVAGVLRKTDIAGGDLERTTQQELPDEKK